MDVPGPANHPPTAHGKEVLEAARHASSLETHNPEVAPKSSSTAQWEEFSYMSTFSFKGG